jgi:hypothetical protein
VANPPKTAFRSRVDGGSSVSCVAGFIVAPSVVGFMAFAPSFLIGWLSFVALIDLIEI